MTDGQQTYVPNVQPPSQIAKELHADGVDVFSIGIGEEIDRVELESFISKKEHIFLAADRTQLLDVLVKEISQALTCEGLWFRCIKNQFLFISDFSVMRFKVQLSFQSFSVIKRRFIAFF